VKARLPALILVCGLTGRAPGALPEAQQYVGRNAWDRVGHARSFLETAQVHIALRSLRSDDRRLLKALKVGALVESEEGFTFSSFCRLHCCPCNHAVVAVHEETGHVYVGFWDSQSGARWVWPGSESTTAPEVLSCGVLRALHYKHMPRHGVDRWCERSDPAKGAR